MNKPLSKDRTVLEVMLIIVTIGLTFLVYRMGGHKIVVLNLFYLPIVLSGYFLGRIHAGLLALLSVLAVTIATTLDSTGMAAYSSPVMVGLALTVWAAALGLIAILVGTLCDQRTKTVEELHAAYIGVVEVLSRYLQSANPKTIARRTRIAELSRAVSKELKLSRKEIDDVGVAALLYDLGNLEITTQVLGKAVDALEVESEKGGAHTFLGADLIHSLGEVLKGAMPLLLNQDDAVRECLSTEEDTASEDIPIGARIIRAVRAYDALTAGDADSPKAAHDNSLQELRKDIASGFDPDVLDAIGRCLQRPVRSSPPELASV